MIDITDLIELSDEELPEAFQETLAKAMFDVIISYLKATADTMDRHGVESLTANDLRSIALEMTVQGYKSSE